MWWSYDNWFGWVGQAKMNLLAADVLGHTALVTAYLSSSQGSRRWTAVWIIF